MAQSQSIFFGNAPGALAQATDYPPLPDLDFGGDFSIPAPLAGDAAAWPHRSDAATASASSPEFSAFGIHVEAAAGQVKDIAQAALSSTLAAARDHAPELKAMAERAKASAVAAADVTRHRATTAIASPEMKMALLGAAALAAVVVSGWMAVPFVVGAVRSGMVQGVATATTSVILEWVNSLTTKPQTDEGTTNREPLHPEGERIVSPPPLLLDVFTGQAEAIDTATVIIGGKTARLAGLSPVQHLGAVQGFNTYLQQAGQLRCQETAPKAGTFTCVTAKGVDIAETAILSGMATAAPEAGDILRRAEREARQNRSGIWGMR